MNRDEERIKKKFERYEKVSVPQRRYFEALNEEFTDKVCFIDSATIEKTVEVIVSLRKQEDNYRDIDILEFLVSWLKENNANE